MSKQLKTVCFLVLIALFSANTGAQPSANGYEFKVLVFSKTEGFRHKQAIPAGIEALISLADEKDFEVDFTEDASQFTKENLKEYKVVVFLCTTGDIFNEQQQKVFRHFINSGGGLVGIHSATDTEKTWSWYGDIIGTYFASHPEIQEATVEIMDSTHLSTAHLPPQWIRRDEWYNFTKHPEGVRVLATLDENTYQGGEMGSDHPVVWCHDNAGGNVWYTALGHTASSYSDPEFIQHLWGGILYAAGKVD